MPEPPKGNSSFSSKLGPIPLKDFDNDFPSGKAPERGKDPAFDKLRDQIAAGMPKPKELLTPREEQLVAEVMAQHPTLTRDEAIKHLREAGM